MIYCIALNIIIRLYETEVTIEVTNFQQCFWLHDRAKQEQISQ